MRQTQLRYFALASVSLALAACSSTPATPPSTGTQVGVLGVKTGATPARAELFAEQNPNWADCGIAWAPGAQCGTLKAPLDWFNPQAGQVDVAILRAPARDPERRRGILLVNPGGPGGEGRQLAAYLALAAPRLSEVYDIIGFDPRGVGASSNLQCSVTLDTSVNYSTQDIAKLIADGCQRNAYAKFVNTEQTVRDMDLIRAALGEQKINYFGYSYGTWLGAWYGARFPERADRFVLDSSVNAARSSLQDTFELQPMARERAVNQGFFPWLARSVRGGTLPYASRMPSDAQALRSNYEQFPAEVKDMLTMAIVQGLYAPDLFVPAALLYDAINAAAQAGPNAELNAESLARQVRERLELAKLDPSTRDRLTASLELQGRPNGLDSVNIPLPASDSTFYAVTCNDGPWTPSGSYWDSFAKRAEKQWPFVGGWYGQQPCAYWNAQFAFPNLPKAFPSMLLVQSEMDSATPYEGARHTRQRLPGARMVTVENEFAHGLYPYGDTCVDGAVEAYLLAGTLPAAGVVCEARPLPLETEVFEVGGRTGPKGKMHQMPRYTAEVQAARAELKDLVRKAASANQPVR